MDQRAEATRPDRATHASPTAPSLTPFLITGTTFFVLLAGANLATQLYAVYQTRFHFSSAVLTLVFATYAIYDRDSTTVVRRHLAAPRPTSIRRSG